MRYEKSCVLAAMQLLLEMISTAANATQAPSQEAAVELAEQYIQSNDYDTERKCPEGLTRFDAVAAFDTQPHCRHYKASEATAFAVEDQEILWRVYFRKAPPSYEDGSESFRVVEVLRTDEPGATRVALKDVDLFLSEKAVLLHPPPPPPPPLTAKDWPPNGYMGIELLESKDRELFAKFAPTRNAPLFMGAGEVYEGYCYVSSNGVNAAFNRASKSEFNTIQISSKPLGKECKTLTISLDRCIGAFCLGQTREEVQRHLAVKLNRDPASGEDLEVAYHEYVVPMTEAQRKVFADDGLTEIPVTHNLWFRFNDEGLYYIGVWRREDLP